MQTPNSKIKVQTVNESVLFDGINVIVVVTLNLEPCLIKEF